MSADLFRAIRSSRTPWNKGHIVGQKRPLQPKHVWSIRVRLEMADNKRDLALFNLAVDGKLRGCDLVCLRVRDVFAAGRVKGQSPISNVMHSTGQPVGGALCDGRFCLRSRSRHIPLPGWRGTDLSLHHRRRKMPPRSPPDHAGRPSVLPSYDSDGP